MRAASPWDPCQRSTWLFTRILGWVFGMGLTGLGIAWLVTTGLALAAIRRRLMLQHQEWMIRSYIVTFAFVTFRLLVGALQAADVAASWFCWSARLLCAEAILQGRKIASSDNAEGGSVRSVAHRDLPGESGYGSRSESSCEIGLSKSCRAQLKFCLKRYLFGGRMPHG